MHVYASLHQAKNYASDEGIAWGAGSTNDDLALSFLESVSRHVDWWCRRSRGFGSGFGPRIGTNRYDSDGGWGLDLRDDLLTTSSVTMLSDTASVLSTTLVEDTDFFLLNVGGSYAPGPFRRAELHGQGATSRFSRGRRVIAWAGTWGHQDVTYPLTATLGAALDNSATEVTVDVLTDLSPGQTIVVDDEQLYVRALTDADPSFSITVVRGVNGTTAASHLDNAPIARQVYDARVVDVTQRLWARRWAARQAGADGADGGGQMGLVSPRESEDTILRRTVNDLRLTGSVVFGGDDPNDHRRIW